MRRGDGPMDFFWELATLIEIMLLGHYIDIKSVAGLRAPSN
ncbi:hypothetical protein [Spirosoma luteum]|nr:hypothetical protein [Spirosoma luteum]